jgi:hypothetical protein
MFEQCLFLYSPINFQKGSRLMVNRNALSGSRTKLGSGQFGSSAFGTGGSLMVPEGKQLNGSMMLLAPGGEKPPIKEMSPPLPHSGKVAPADVTPEVKIEVSELPPQNFYYCLD